MFHAGMYVLLSPHTSSVGDASGVHITVLVPISGFGLRALIDFAARNGSRKQ